MYSVTLSGEFFNYRFEHVTDMEIKNHNIKLQQEDNFYNPTNDNVNIEKVNKILIEVE